MSETDETITTELLREIGRVGSTRESIAAIYRRGIQACHQVQEIAAVDWHTVNAALLRRYTPSGLNYIKALAWKSDRREVRSMNTNHEGAAEGQTEKPSDQGATEGAGQTDGKPTETKPAPDGD
jgi:hypothetical protein